MEKEGQKEYENTVTNTANSSSSNHENHENEEEKVFQKQENSKNKVFQKFIIGIVDSKLFGGAILCIILLNTIILIVQTDEKTSVKGGKEIIYKKFIKNIS